MGVGGMGYDLHGGPPRAGSKPAAGAADTWVQVAGGGNHWLTLRADGTMIAWGNNEYGQLPIPGSALSVVAVDVGAFHTVALRAEGQVIGWGYDGAPPVSLTQAVAIAAGWNHSAALTPDGTVVMWGDARHFQAAGTPKIEGGRKVFAGYNLTAVLDAEGFMHAWGDDPFGKVTTLAQASKVALVGMADDFSVVVPDPGEPILGRLPSTVQVAHGGHLLLQPQVRVPRLTRLQWYREGQPIEGATESSLIIESVKAEEGGHYHLVAEVEGHMVESEVV